MFPFVVQLEMEVHVLPAEQKAKLPPKSATTKMQFTNDTIILQTRPSHQYFLLKANNDATLQTATHTQKVGTRTGRQEKIVTRLVGSARKNITSGLGWRKTEREIPDPGGSIETGRQVTWTFFYDRHNRRSSRARATVRRCAAAKAFNKRMGTQ